MIEQREPADSEALAQFLAFAPEPGTAESEERFLLSDWNGWHLLADYGSFGALREIYTHYPVPIIQFTVPSGSDLTHLADVPDFRLDLMVGQHFYFVFVRNGTIWRDEMHDGPSGKAGRHLVLQGEEAVRVDYPLNLNEFPGYGSESHVTFTSHLGQCLQSLGLPIQHWQNQSEDIVNEVLKIVDNTNPQSLPPSRRV